MLISGSAPIGEVLGAATAALRPVMASIGALVETGRFESREIGMGGFFVFFVAVAVLGTIVTVFQLVGWARAGEGAGEGRRRALIGTLALVIQLAFLIFIGIIFTTL